MHFKVGDRVRIKCCKEWPDGGVGNIEEPPEFIVKLVGDQRPWIGHTRLREGLDGMHVVYWVEFDQPANDWSGDGPYNSSEVLEDDLEALEPSG